MQTCLSNPIDALSRKADYGHRAWADAGRTFVATMKLRVEYRDGGPCLDFGLFQDLRSISRQSNDTPQPARTLAGCGTRTASENQPLTENREKKLYSGTRLNGWLTAKLMTIDNNAGMQSIFLILSIGEILC